MRRGQPYDHFVYIEPTRTEILRGIESLPLYEQQGWWSQFKKNGSRSVVFVPPDRNPFFADSRGRRQPASWNRHFEPRSGWQFNQSTWEIFRSIKGNRWCVIDGELIHHQTKHIKYIHYLYDILVWDGYHLTGTTYAERYALLWEIFSPILTGQSARSPSRRSARLTADRITTSHIVLDEYTWLARNHHTDLAGLFGSLTQPEDEGLVLRDPNGIYLGARADDWMVKVRKVNSLRRQDAIKK